MVIALRRPQTKMPIGTAKTPVKKFYLLGFMEPKPKMVPAATEN